MATPVRIAHISDTHLGYRALFRADPETGRNQRAVDFERAFERAVDDILERKPDLVIHGGDVFHHTRPSWPALRCFVRQMRRLEAAKLPALVIAGNHDTPRLRTSGSAFSLLEMALPEVRFVAEYADEEVAFDPLDLVVHAVPHGALTNPDPVLALPTPGVRNILLTHGMVPGLIGKRHHEPGEEELGDHLLDAGFDYVALGHYHLWGPQGHRAWYSGSTERTGFGDENANPGYVLVTLGDPGAEPDVEKVDLPARPMRTLAPVSGEGRDARELADIALDRAATFGEPEAIARITFTDTPRLVRRAAERLIRRESPAVIWSLQVVAETDILAAFGERPAETGANTADLRLLFGQFVAERTGNPYDDAFAAAFAAKGAKALDQAIQAAEATATPEDPAA